MDGVSPLKPLTSPNCSKALRLEFCVLREEVPSMAYLSGVISMDGTSMLELWNIFPLAAWKQVGDSIGYSSIRFGYKS
jgi:hypothetical protein